MFFFFFIFYYLVLKKSSLNPFRWRWNKRRRKLSPRCPPRTDSPNLHRTTDATLDWKAALQDPRKLREQARARGSYIQESCTTYCLHHRWTDLVAVESDCSSLLWQNWLESFFRSLDCHRSPSRTNRKSQGCGRIHNRTDKPALWQLTFQLERWSFQTCHLWPQNTLESDWASASDLKCELNKEHDR